VKRFRWSRVPVIAQTKFKRQTVRELPAVHTEDAEVIHGDTAWVVARRKREAGRSASGKLSHVCECQCAGIRREIVVVDAAEFTTELERVSAVHPVVRIRQDAGCVATTLRESIRTAECNSRRTDRDKGQSSGRVNSVLNTKAGRILQGVGRKHNMDA